MSLAKNLKEMCVTTILAEMWTWNTETYNPGHADDYARFLEDPADKLENTYDKGKPVAVRPDYCWEVAI